MLPWRKAASPSWPGGWSGSAASLTGCGRMASRRSATNTAQLIETVFVSPVTGYAHDDEGNLVYLGMVGHKTVLDSIRATIQARQRKKLFLQGRPVYPLPSHYYQTWQHLPDYGAYHAALIADLALPGKWQTGEEVAYLLVFECAMSESGLPENQACHMLTSRLSEALPVPIMDSWAVALWEVGLKKELIGELSIAGDCLAGYWIHISETGWADTLTWLFQESLISISSH
jgi:hypothetical protein